MRTGAPTLQVSTAANKLDSPIVAASTAWFWGVTGAGSWVKVKTWVSRIRSDGG